MLAYFGTVRKWLGPRQRTGIVNKQELREMGGEKTVEEFIALTKPPN
jgi:hypothetical protein